MENFIASSAYGDTAAVQFYKGSSTTMPDFFSFKKQCNWCSSLCDETADLEIYMNTSWN